MLPGEFPTQTTPQLWNPDLEIRGLKKAREQREPWGVSKVLQANVSPGVGATSLPASFRGLSGPAGGTACEQDEVAAS